MVDEIPDYIQVQITFPAAELAYEVAEKLVAGKLVACAQVAGAIRSYYVWQGENKVSNEVLLLAKTKRTLFDRLVEAVRENHPYECPQIVALPLVLCSSGYLAWLEEQLR